MGRRSVHSPEELRQLILDASQTIVERSGITGLSAREIARMIGYSPGTLYNIFENLDDILLTLQVQLQTRTVEHLKHVPFGLGWRKEHRGFELRRMSTSRLPTVACGTCFWRIAFHPEPRCRSLLHDNINKIAGIVRTAVAPLAPNTPREKLEAMAWALWTGIHGITAVAATEKGVYVTPATAQSYAKDLAVTFVRGLREH